MVLTRGWDTHVPLILADCARRDNSSGAHACTIGNERARRPKREKPHDRSVERGRGEKGFAGGETAWSRKVGSRGEKPWRQANGVGTGGLSFSLAAASSLFDRPCRARRAALFSYFFFPPLKRRQQVMDFGCGDEGAFVCTSTNQQRRACQAVQE